MVQQVQLYSVQENSRKCANMKQKIIDFRYATILLTNTHFSHDSQRLTFEIKQCFIITQLSKTKLHSLCD